MKRREFYSVFRNPGVPSASRANDSARKVPSVEEAKRTVWELNNTAVQTGPFLSEPPNAKEFIVEPRLAVPDVHLFDRECICLGNVVPSGYSRNEAFAVLFFTRFCMC